MPRPAFPAKLQTNRRAVAELHRRFAVALREEHPADDDDVLQEMSERRFLPQLSTAVQRKVKRFSAEAGGSEEAG